MPAGRAGGGLAAWKPPKSRSPNLLVKRRGRWLRMISQTMRFISLTSKCAHEIPAVGWSGPLARGIGPGDKSCRSRSQVRTFNTDLKLSRQVSGTSPLGPRLPIAPI